jgi:altronate dehydratase
MASTGEPVDLLRRVLAGYATHVNMHSTLMIGLGCEANQINDLMAAQNLKRSHQLQTMTIQETGGTRKTVQEGIARIKELLPEANNIKRAPAPVSHITLGLQCGGSTATRASPPTRLGGRICWCATAVPPSCPRRLRSAPSTCSRAARVHREVARS